MRLPFHHLSEYLRFGRRFRPLVAQDPQLSAKSPRQITTSGLHTPSKLPGEELNCVGAKRPILATPRTWPPPPPSRPRFAIVHNSSLWVSLGLGSPADAAELLGLMFKWVKWRVRHCWPNEATRASPANEVAPCPQPPQLPSRRRSGAAVLGTGAKGVCNVPSGMSGVRGMDNCCCCGEADGGGGPRKGVRKGLGDRGRGEV